MVKAYIFKIHVNWDMLFSVINLVHEGLGDASLKDAGEYILCRKSVISTIVE